MALLKVLLILACVTWLIFKRWQNRNIRKLWNKLPCDIRSFPIIGHSYLFIGNGEDRMNAFRLIGREALKHGGWTKLKMGSQFTVLADPVDADVALKTCLEKDDITKVAKYYLGNGNIFASVPIWRPRRKIMCQAFKMQNLLTYVDIFSKQSHVLIDKFQTKIGNGPFSLWKYFTTFTMDSICETGIGCYLGSQDNPEEPFLKAFETALEVTSARFCQPWLQNDKIFKYLPHHNRALNSKLVMDAFIDQNIKQKFGSSDTIHKLNYDYNSNIQDRLLRINPILDILIKKSESIGGYSIEELREEMLVLTVAAIDTSAVVSGFTSLMLAKHQDVQNKIYNELKEKLGDINRPIIAEDLGHLKYLDAVIKEVLRLYPPATVITRKVTEDVELPSGITLLKNTSVLVNIWALHRNTKYWGKDAEEFRPERFLEGPLKHPAAFMAFSYGPRNCVGTNYALLAIKTLLSSILLSYKLLPESENQDLCLKFDMLMKDAGGYKVRIVKR